MACLPIIIYHKQRRRNAPHTKTLGLYGAYASRLLTIGKRVANVVRLYWDISS